MQFIGVSILAKHIIKLVTIKSNGNTAESSEQILEVASKDFSAVAVYPSDDVHEHRWSYRKTNKNISK